MTHANALLDSTKRKLKLKNDTALSRALEVGPPVISKIRHGRLPVGDNMLCRIHEATGQSIAYLRKQAGIAPLLSTTRS